jgi:hypothetical protein
MRVYATLILVPANLQEKIQPYVTDTKKRKLNFVLL